MCAIIGALLDATPDSTDREEAVRVLRDIVHLSIARGRDGRGFSNNAQVRKSTARADVNDVGLFYYEPDCTYNVIGNLRAEPTTEYVEHKRKEDQQPYSCGPWTVVHNGTIANDAELRTHAVQTTIDSAAIPETLERCSYAASPSAAFLAGVQKLRGSYAILAQHASHERTLFVAANYRPVWYCKTPLGYYFASAAEYLVDTGAVPQMLPPYTAWRFSLDYEPVCLDRSVLQRQRALVVCSGGLDSVVAATIACRQYADVHLLHFQYGCRAEAHEVDAVQKVARYLGVPLRVLPIRSLYDDTDSPLLDKDTGIAGGEEGAEFAHEWVPARNLVMLAHATAYAEAKGFDTIVLGNNLEEAGAYPDNEPEFIRKMNALLPFAVGDGKHVRIDMPVGDLMKHEIVALGHAYAAPMHLTWSCYKHGTLHCGKCGPCFMRRTAFQINGIEDTMVYEA